MIGYSFGGLVVIEMARIVRAAGRELGLVGLLDSTCDEKFWPRSEWFRVVRRRAWRRLAEMRAMSPGAAARHLAGRASALLRHFRRRLDASAEAGTSGQSIYYIGGLDPDFQRVRDASIIAFEAHSPKAFDGRVVLFRSTTGDPHACDPIGIWKRLIRDLEIVIVPGSHTTMIRKPLAQTLASEIAIRLR
jgi:thioesterase domain-containing protein